MNEKHALHAIFRCDAGREDGLGHIKRCLNLAQVLTQRGCRVEFVTTEGPGQIGASVLRQPALYANRTSKSRPGSLEDATLLADMRDEETTRELLIIDSKRIQAEYLTALRETFITCVIDDDANVGIHADILINGRLDARREMYADSASNIGSYLCGARYNMVAPEYFDLTDRPSEDCVLVTLGGEDPGNMTRWILNCLAPKYPEKEFYAVVGPAHPDPASIAEVAVSNANIVIVESPESLAPYIAKCSTAISAGGTTCYELSAARRPFGIVLLEAHQTAFARSIVDCGAGILALDVGETDARKMTEAFQAICNSNQAETIRKIQTRTFPQSGLTAVADALLELSTCGNLSQ